MEAVNNHFQYLYLSLSLSASMSVKDILQSLVDDALVDSDRIGTSNYFWAFPSKAINNVRTPSFVLNQITYFRMSSLFRERES